MTTSQFRSAWCADRPERPLSARRVFVATTILVSVALVSACGGGSTATSDTTGPVRLLEPAEFAAYIDENPDVNVVNVHVPYEGHIAGTDAFVDYRTILEYPDLPGDRDDPVVLYCRSGNMSGIAAATLADAGFTNVVDLNGGMNAWVDSGRDLLTEQLGAN